MLEGIKARVVPDLQERSPPERHSTCCIPLAPIHLYFHLLKPQAVFLPWHFHESTWMGYVDTDTRLFLKTVSGFVCSNSFLKTCLKVLIAHLWLSAVLVLQQ